MIQLHNLDHAQEFGGDGLYSEALLFPACRKRRVEARFDGGDVTSNGGVLLLRQADRLLGLTAAVAHGLPDDRQRGKVPPRRRQARPRLTAQRRRSGITAATPCQPTPAHVRNQPQTRNPASASRTATQADRRQLHTHPSAIQSGPKAPPQELHEISGLEFPFSNSTQ